MDAEVIHEGIKQDAAKAVEALRKDLSKLRTGRASVAMLDGIKVNYYGKVTPLNQVATLTVPEPRQIIIQPWDISSVGDIEKAILASDLGLTPLNQGKVIRIVIPELTEERRKDLAKVVRKRNEEAKVAMRHLRKEANDQLKKMEKDKGLTEDELHRALKKVQDSVDEFIKKCDEVEAAKEKEILEF